MEYKLNAKNNELQNLLNQNNSLVNNEITSLKRGEKIINVNFVSIGNQDICNYSLICKNTDLFVRLEEKLYQGFPQFKNYETFFKVNTRRIKRFKTIDENKIKSNDIISIFIVEEDEDNQK